MRLVGISRALLEQKRVRIRVTPGHLGWADVIFVMEKRHQERLRAKFRQALVGKRMVCLHIADDYGYMDDALVRLLETAVTPHTASVVDPFGNILGIMYNRHYLDVLSAAKHAWPRLAALPCSAASATVEVI